jgi:hypothetical protein
MSFIPYQNGEKEIATTDQESNDKFVLDTYAGKVNFAWDDDAETTLVGPMIFFIEFLKISKLLDRFVEDCPLTYSGPNASSIRDILGTILLSVVSGHKRYAHITAIRSDTVIPDLLGMKKVVSEDSARRGLINIPEVEGMMWLEKHLDKTYNPLLQEPWILDIDTTIKPIYGHQEGAEIGYNPKKPGRPSHVYHTYIIANLRLILDVDVGPGNLSAAKDSAPKLWKIIDKLDIKERPYCIRGDCLFGNDKIMLEAEQRQLGFLFKLKSTSNVKKKISKLMDESDWVYAGHGWEGTESQIKLAGWQKTRRIIVLRRRFPREVMLLEKNANQKLLTNFVQLVDKVDAYEYAVLVTNLSEDDTDIFGISQLYRDRGDCENIFDELKNQWGWGGYTTHDLKRCNIMAKIVALIYNWWNLYCRLANPNTHLEAITSRPLLLHGVGKQTSHSGKTHLKVKSSHGKSNKVKSALGAITCFLQELRKVAERLSEVEIWLRILSRALCKFLQGRTLEPRIRYLASG